MSFLLQTPSSRSFSFHRLSLPLLFIFIYILFEPSITTVKQETGKTPPHAHRMRLCTTVFDDFVDSGRMSGSKHLLSAIYALVAQKGMQSTVHSSTDCERISDLSVNITHVIPCSPGVCPPQARHRRRWVYSSPPYRRAAGAAGGQPVGGKPAGDQPRARRRRCRRPARCRRGRFPLLPDKGGHEARWEVPKREEHLVPTINHPAGLHSPSDLSTDDPRDAR